MATNSKRIEATKLDRESKILLLTILKQGYITAEQKQAFSSLLEVKTTQVIYVAKPDDFKDLQKMYEEIEATKEGDKNMIPDGYVQTPDFDKETIKQIQ